MPGPTLAPADAGATPVESRKHETFRSALRGKLLGRSMPGYDEARTVWNAMIDRKPAFIARCEAASDIVHAIDFARSNNFPVAVRGGGHNIAGSAICDDGIVIDLSLMRSVRVDPQARRAWVEPGATLADVDRATQDFGLAVPTGVNSTTGIAGLTLGGGFGWITRKYGLTIDNMLSTEIVTAAGEVLHASGTEHPDLFWALRGGGGNFGVVTGFEFLLSPVGPDVFSGLIVHPLGDAQVVLKALRKVIEEAPDELTCWAVMRQAPPLPFLPPEWHGKEVLVLAVCYCGNVADGERATQHLLAIGNPIASHISAAPFCEWQQAFDPLLTPGARNYWKSHDLTALSDAAIDVLIAGARHLPGAECEIFIAHIGGAASRVAADATAFPQRHSHFVMNVHGRWRDPKMDQTCIAWARTLFSDMRPHAAGTAYVNFMPNDEGDRVVTAYGGNFHRLVAVKQRYDPLNFFHMNQNIRPPAHE
jgi:FAD/FMN-containing dehydrogenase